VRHRLIGAAARTTRDRVMQQCLEDCAVQLARCRVEARGKKRSERNVLHGLIVRTGSKPTSSTRSSTGPRRAPLTANGEQKIADVPLDRPLVILTCFAVAVAHIAPRADRPGLSPNAGSRPLRGVPERLLVDALQPAPERLQGDALEASCAFGRGSSCEMSAHGDGCRGQRSGRTSLRLPPDGVR